MPHDMIPTENTDAFLRENRLRLRKNGNVYARRDDWTITDAKKRTVLVMEFWGSSVGPKLKFHVNTNKSSRHFPMTTGAKHLFSHHDLAFAWFDALLYHLQEDIGDFTCTVVTGKTDTDRFERQGFTRENDARAVRLDKYITGR